MTANSKGMKRTARQAGTLEGIRPGETLEAFERRVGDDVPEWTDEDFARARPVDDFPELKAILDRTRGQRGPQKTPTKERVTLRLNRELVESYRADGPGWQTRINDDLVKLNKRRKHG
jgi:uncharacterized protein (DUF4415 family)